MGGKEIVMLVIVIVGFVFAVVAAVTRILGVGGWTRINYRMSTGILVMLTVVWGILIAAALGFGIYLFAVLKITGETAKTVLLVLLVVCPLIFNNGIISALVCGQKRFAHKKPKDILSRCVFSLSGRHFGVCRPPRLYGGEGAVRILKRKGGDPE